MGTEGLDFVLVDFHFDDGAGCCGVSGHDEVAFSCDCKRGLHGGMYWKGPSGELRVRLNARDACAQQSSEITDDPNPSLMSASHFDVMISNSRNPRCYCSPLWAPPYPLNIMALCAHWSAKSLSIVPFFRIALNVMARRNPFSHLKAGVQTLLFVPPSLVDKDLEATS